MIGIAAILLASDSSITMTQFRHLRSLGTTPILKKGHSRSNSRNSGAFSEQLSEWFSRPNLCENHILGSTLGATLGNGWTPKFQPKFSDVFFKIGVVPAPDHLSPRIQEVCLADLQSSHSFGLSNRTSHPRLENEQKQICRNPALSCKNLCLLEMLVVVLDISHSYLAVHYAGVQHHWICDSSSSDSLHASSTGSAQCVSDHIVILVRSGVYWLQQKVLPE